MDDNSGKKRQGICRVCEPHDYDRDPEHIKFHQKSHDAWHGNRCLPTATSVTGNVERSPRRHASDRQPDREYPTEDASTYGVTADRKGGERGYFENQAERQVQRVESEHAIKLATDRYAPTMTPTRDDLVALTLEPGSFLDSEDATLRRLAVTSLDEATFTDMCNAITALVDDPSTAVRAAVAEKLGACGDTGGSALDRLRGDPEPTVREAVATAYGEIGDSAQVEWLVERVRSDDDRQVKEAAVAALGAIGDPAAIDHLIEFVTSGPPQVRRRAIAAITVFDDDRIESVLRRAAMDRNPGVREAAEMVVGRQITEA